MSQVDSAVECGSGFGGITVPPNRHGQPRGQFLAADQFDRSPQSPLLRRYVHSEGPGLKHNPCHCDLYVQASRPENDNYTRLAFQSATAGPLMLRRLSESCC